MRRRTSLMVGLALGLGAACSGGKDPATLNGTAFFVTVFFNTTLDVRALEFIGTNKDGNDVFKRESRPSPPATTRLKSPETARILLQDSLRGQTIDLSVFGFDNFNERVEYGAASGKVVEGREVDVTVNMKPLNLGTGGGAGGGAGGAGGGGVIALDAGVPDGGVPGQCTCTTGCCLPGETACFPPIVTVFPLGTVGLPNLVVGIVACGAKSGGICTLGCDPLRANRCDNTGQCRCGPQPACKHGMRCGETAAGTFACVCDQFSQCSGCCGPVPGGTGPNGIGCRGPDQADLTNFTACGAAGNVCAVCTGIAGVDPQCVFGPDVTGGSPGACSNSVQCVGCKDASQCCTHLSCATIAFPTCRSPNSRSCIACDVIRSDQCRPGEGCGCGPGPQCPPLQSCRHPPSGGLPFCG